MAKKINRQQIVDDYFNSGLTIKQIAMKNDVCIRTVCKAVEGRANRSKIGRNSGRKAIRLNKDETELLIGTILEYDYICKDENERLLLHSIEDRLLEIADDLT